MEFAGFDIMLWATRDHTCFLRRKNEKSNFFSKLIYLLCNIHRILIHVIRSDPCFSSFSPFGRLVGVLVPTVGGIKVNENLCHANNGM